MKSLLLFAAVCLMAAPSCCFAQCENGQCAAGITRSWSGPLGFHATYQRPAFVPRTVAAGVPTVEYVPSYARARYAAPVVSYGSTGSAYGGSSGNYSRVIVRQRVVVRAHGSHGG